MAQLLHHPLQSPSGFQCAVAGTQTSARPSPIHVSSVNTAYRLLHSVSVSLTWATSCGDLRLAGISRFSATPLRLTGPHHSRRGLPIASFYIGFGTRVLPLRMIPQELLDRRSPGYLPVVVQLDAVLDPGGSVSRSSIPRSPHGLRPMRQDRQSPKIVVLGATFQIQGYTLHLEALTFLPPALAFRFNISERLTKPYSGGPLLLRRVPSQQVTIARLPP